MGYRLGVDLGTTYTACAVQRDGRVEVVHLGDHGAEVPSVVFLREDGTFLVGEAAERRGLAAPHRLAREFKRRIGDPTPLLLAGTPYSAHALTATLLRWVVDRVVEREGGAPEQVVVTHPANWGPYKRESLQHGVELADVGSPRLCSEPEAAAVRYASLERLQPGDVVAVYDLGGGTFDTAVLTRTDDGFTLLGAPAGIEQLGGVDFDDALFSHVVQALGPAVEDVDPEDPATATALTRLRRDCVLAKEALSQDTEITVPVGLPDLHTQVRVTRSEFEDLVRPSVAQTVVALRRALRSAQVEPERLSAVLLAGGSSRIPLVAQTLSAELGRPVAVDAHPKHLVALGAALVGTPAAVPAPRTEQHVDGRRVPAGSGSDAPPTAATGTPTSGVGASAPSLAAPPTPVPTPVPTPASTPGTPPVPTPVRDGLRAGSRKVRRAVRPGDRRVLAVATGVLTAALLGIAALGLDAVRTGAPASSLPFRLEINGVDPARADAVVPLRHPAGGERVTVVDSPAPAGTQVRGRLALADVFRPQATAAELDAPDPRLDFTGSEWLLPGQTVGSITVVRGGEILGSATFVADPEDPPLLTLPFVLGLVGLLFALAYLEALAGPVRRGRAPGPLTTAGAAALGAVGGLSLAVLGWVLHDHLLLRALLVTCALLGAGAAALGLRLLAVRAAADPPSGDR